MLSTLHKMLSSGVTVVFAPCVVSTMYLNPHHVTSTFLYVLSLFEASFMLICQIWRAINGQLTCNNHWTAALATLTESYGDFTFAFVGNLRNTYMCGMNNDNQFFSMQSNVLNRIMSTSAWTYRLLWDRRAVCCRARRSRAASSQSSSTAWSDAWQRWQPLLH